MNLHLRNLFIILILLFNSLKPAVTYTGNSTTGGTFTFSVGPTAYNILSRLKLMSLYTGASVADVAQNYAIARMTSGGVVFEGLTPQNTSVNGQGGTNPLYNAKINYLDLYGTVNPVAVKDGDKRLFAFKDVTTTKDLYASPNINDSNGAVTNQILGLKAIANAMFVLPVQNNAGGTFGASGSGLAVGSIVDNSTKNSEGQVTNQLIELEMLNADPNSVSSDKNIAAPLDNTSTSLKINNDVTINSNEIDVTWFSSVQRFYVALQLTSNAAAGSGARALAVGYINGQGKLILNPIAPDAVFSGNNQIVGTGDASSDVSIVKVRSMVTSTGLTYLIVLGANGAKTSVQNRVYALPIVNLNGNVANSSTQGTLANVNQNPTNYYINNKYLNRRYFSEPATSPGEVFTTSSVAAQVGAGALPIDATNSVSDLIVLGDMVIASIDQAFSINDSPGIYFSKAMYDDEGKVKSWTPWQRLGSTVNQISAAVPDIYSGNVLTLQNSGSSSCTVQKTSWTQGNGNGLSQDNTGLVALISDDFENENGGLQGLNDFANYTAGFSDFSLMIATGVKKLALIESGDLQGGFYKPTGGNFSTNSVESTNGIISSIPVGSKYVVVSGGDLNSVGPIVTSTVANNSDDNLSWIIVGGYNGVAALIDSNGEGWTGDISNLSDLPNNIYFKKIGNFKNVVKVISSDNYLYVLTLKALYRVELNATDFKNGTTTQTIIAEPAKMNLSNLTTFSDFVVSESLGILATSNGMFRVGNGQNITTATSTAQLNWTFITSPGSFGPVFKIYTLSNNVNQNKFTQNGQLYVLNSYIGYNNSSVSRFSVNLDGAIDDNTIVSVPDEFIKDINSNLIDFSAFRDSFNVIGTNQFATHSKDVNNKNSDGELELPFAQILKPFISSASILTFLDSSKLKLDLPENSSIISSPIFLRSSNGGLLLSGDFGLKVNE